MLTAGSPAEHWWVVFLSYPKERCAILADSFRSWWYLADTRLRILHNTIPILRIVASNMKLPLYQSDLNGCHLPTISTTQTLASFLIWSLPWPTQILRYNHRNAEVIINWWLLPEICLFQAQTCIRTNTEKNTQSRSAATASVHLKCGKYRQHSGTYSGRFVDSVLYV